MKTVIKFENRDRGNPAVVWICETYMRERHNILGGTFKTVAMDLGISTTTARQWFAKYNIQAKSLIQLAKERALIKKLNQKGPNNVEYHDSKRSHPRTNSAPQEHDLQRGLE